MQQQYPSDAWALLAPRLTPERRKKMAEVASERSNYLRLVVQDVHNPHNVSACLRSAEAFGVLNVDVVSLSSQFKPSSVARGVANWLRVKNYTDIPACANELKRQGYALAAGMPRQDSLPLHELPLDRPLAVLFGNEHAGVSPEWLPYLDYSFTIPMFGIVESLNISVCAAISMQHLAHKARQTVEPGRLFLSEPEKNALLCEWVCRQINSWEGECHRLRQKL